MKVKVKPIKIDAAVNIVFIPFKLAKELGVNINDRVIVKYGKKKAVCVVDLIYNSKSKIILANKQACRKLNLKKQDFTEITLLPKPVAVDYIRKKLDGNELKEREINEIIRAIVENELTDVEKTYFVAANYIHGMSDAEIVALTKAIANHGQTLRFKGIVVDKHCAGGIPGNRTTMLIVPIVAAAGLKIPKTSSRSITSPAGTADTMEVLANVVFNSKQIKRIVEKTNGCIVWGGINLAPADDKLIKIRHPLNLDPTGMLLASILAKKYAVGSKYVLIDLPVGKTAKMTYDEAERLSKLFIRIGKLLGMKIEVIITDGSEPIGNGIGPALEARDVLKVLMQYPDRPRDLEEKAIEMSGIIFDMVNVKKFGKSGRELAEYILKSGLAYKKMCEIIRAQGGKICKPEQIKLAKYYLDYTAKKSGKIKEINNKTISEIAKISGAPVDKAAGIYLFKHVNDKVKKGEPLFRIYAESKNKLNVAIQRVRFFEKESYIIKIK